VALPPLEARDYKWLGDVAPKSAAPGWCFA
jgi:hypothetical protein